MILEKKNLRSLERWNFKTTDRIGKYLRLDRNEKVEKLFEDDETYTKVQIKDQLKSLEKDIVRTKF